MIDRRRRRGEDDHQQDFTALRVPLPGGKVLRLGPKKTGHVSPHDFDHPPLKELVEAGQIELVDDIENQAIPTRENARPFEE